MLTSLAFLSSDGPNNIPYPISDLEISSNPVIPARSEIAGNKPMLTFSLKGR